MNDIQVGDWVTLVNLDDDDLNHLGSVCTLGARYQVTEVGDYGGATITVEGIYCQEPNGGRINRDWPIYASCFQREDPFVTAVREITDEEN